MPCKCGIRPVAVKVISVLLCRNQPGSATSNALLSRRRVWLFCLSQYPSDSASKQPFDTDQSTPDKPQLRPRRVTRARILPGQICSFERTYQQLSEKS